LMCFVKLKILILFGIANPMGFFVFLSSGGLMQASVFHDLEHHLAKFGWRLGHGDPS